VRSSRWALGAVFESIVAAGMAVFEVNFALWQSLMPTVWGGRAPSWPVLARQLVDSGVQVASRTFAPGHARVMANGRRLGKGS
jgi:hypothetical protein